MDFRELGFTPGETVEEGHVFIGKGKGVASITDIFPNDEKLHDLLLGKKGEVPVKEIGRRRKTVIRQIFYRALILIFKRIIVGDTFISPVRDEIYAKSIPDDVVKKLRQAGHYKNIDIVKANFILPDVVYALHRRSKLKVISLPKRLRNEMMRNVENGTLRLVRVLTNRIL